MYIEEPETSRAVVKKPSNLSRDTSTPGSIIVSGTIIHKELTKTVQATQGKDPHEVKSADTSGEIDTQGSRNNNF